MTLQASDGGCNFECHPNIQIGPVPEIGLRDLGKNAVVREATLDAEYLRSNPHLALETR